MSDTTLLIEKRNRSLTRKRVGVVGRPLRIMAEGVGSSSSRRAVAEVEVSSSRKRKVAAGVVSKSKHL